MAPISSLSRVMHGQRHLSGVRAGKGQARLTQREVLLGPRQVLALRGNARGVRIEALGCRLWITQSSGIDDIILNPGERFTITMPGVVVIQGM
jgi:hypothetical protein